MINISVYQGLGQFGQAYKVMFENDTYAPGSIDRVLMENMVQLCSETVDYLYSEYTPPRSFYERGTRPELEQCIEEAVVCCHSDEERIETIARFTSGLQKKASDDLDLMRLGGTEEEIMVLSYFS